MNRRALLALLATAIAACACSSDPAPGGPIVLGGVGGGGGAARLEIGRDGSSVVLFGADGGRRLSFTAQDFQLGVVRALDGSLSYDPWWLVPHGDFSPDPPADLRWLKAVSASAEERASGREASLVLDLEGGAKARVDLELVAEDGRFLLHFVPDPSSLGGAAIAWVRLGAGVDPSEGFYGLGEWPDSVNHRGKLRPMQLEGDLAIENGSNENHVPVPLLVGTSGFGLFVESKRVGMFDVATSRPDRVEITFGTAESSGEGLRVHLYSAAHPLDVLGHYYRTTGFPRVPAPWALGPWIWRDENRDQAEVESDVETIRRLDLATTAIWIDRPYATAVNTFDFHPTRFPDPERMVRTVHDSGLRLALWSTPYLEPTAEPLLTEARTRGFFPPVVGTQLNRWGAPLDLTNPEAYAWWQSLLRRYKDLGIEGYKLDYAEDVIAGLGGGRNVYRFFDGSDERTMHYGYTLLYHRLYQEMLPAEGSFLLCRTGRWGDQVNVSVIWPGDMDARFVRHRERIDGKIAVGGLPATVIQGMSLGASGFPFFGADTGGYLHSPPPKEVFIRWFEQTALSTVMQVGDSSSQPPWEFTRENGRDEETLALYRRYARLHLRLFPYLWTHAQRVRADGRPIQRALGLAFPALAQHPDDIYLMGDDLLVAPVVDEGLRERRVIFPPGRWRHWWSGAVFEGEAMVAAPLDELPLFLREGGVVPMLRPTIDTISAVADPGAVDSYATTPGRLTLRIAPGAEGGFVLFDGTRVEVTPPLSIRLEPGSVFTHGSELEVIGFGADAPGSVRAADAEITRFATDAALEGVERGWTFTSSTGGTVRVRLPSGSHAIEIRARG